MQNTRPYSNLSEIGRRQRQDRIAFLYLKCVLAVLGIILTLAFLRIIFLSSPVKSQQLIPEHRKAEFSRLIKKHGLYGKVAVIEINQEDGTLWFMRDGQRCRFN